MRFLASKEKRYLFVLLFINTYSLLKNQEFFSKKSIKFILIEIQMAQQFVENVLAVHKKYLDMIKEVFQGDQAFIGALDKACNAVINHRQPKQPSKAPELVSLIFKEFETVH